MTVEDLEALKNDLEYFTNGNPISIDYEHSDVLHLNLDWSCKDAPDLTYVVACFMVNDEVEPDTGWPIDIMDINAAIEDQYEDITEVINSFSELKTGTMAEYSETNSEEHTAYYFLTVHMPQNVG